MTKRSSYFAMLLSLALILMACQLAQQAGEQIAGPTNANNANRETDTPVGKASPTMGQADLAATKTPEKDDPALPKRDKPPQSQAAEIRPKDMRTKLTHLSNLIGYTVLDENGEKLGVASDYIVNTCETYIIYILMEPVASLNVATGGWVVIPFEAVTINSGVLDGQNETIQLRLIPEQFSGAPTFSSEQALTPTDWEAAVRAFWKNSVRVGMLATSCNVAGGPVYKIAYATQLLQVELFDGQNNLLGSVQEAILEPESGKLGFLIVKPTTGDGLIMVHLGAVNIPKEALLPGSTLTLILLSDPQVFWDAPRITSIEEADDFALQSKMRQYWDK